MIKEAILLVFLGLLAWEDLRKMEVSYLTLLAAGGAGFVFMLMHPAGGLQELAFRFLPGGLLLAGTFITRGKIGPGDGMAFLVCGLYLQTEQVWGLLTGSFLIAAAVAAVFLASRRKSGKEAFAFLPCVFAADCLGFIIRLAGSCG